VKGIRAAAVLLAAAGAVLPGAGPVAAEEKDPLFRAMEDELARSMKRLRLEDKPAPYFVSYAVQDEEKAEASASFGALTDRGRGKDRSLSVEVKIGDHALDSGNFGGGLDLLALLGFGGLGGGSPAPADDDYDALRHRLWQHTDAAYKASIEQLEAKKAWLQQNEVKDRPPDFSKETPIRRIEPVATLEVDLDAMAAAVRRASAAFREFPAIQESHAMFVARARNRRFVNSEGFRVLRSGREAGLILLASAQAPDGMRLVDCEVFTSPLARDLPAAEALEKAARALAERLTALAAAAPTAEYRGPVLLEGGAAAGFLSQSVANHVGNAHVSLGGDDNPMANMMGNQWKQKIGQKVMPGFLTLASDPAAAEWKGVPILGGWTVDDDGVPAQKVVVIEKGVLRTFCHARLPSREIAASNGHSRGGTGNAGPLFLSSENRLPAKELRARAAELAKEDGQDHYLVVRRLSNMLTGAMNPKSMMSSFMGAFSGGGVAVLPPLAIHRVSIADGSETLLRGGSFGTVTLRVLRDIEATGDDEAAWPVIRGPEAVQHVVCPSLLVKEMEIRKPGKETEKLPAIPHPWFEGK
jgi:TldD protein